MTATEQREWRAQGGGFLLRPAATEDAYSPEDFTEEHLAIARTTEEFFRNEVAPQLEAMQRDPMAAVPLLRKAAALGLTGVMIPDRFGGMELDLTSLLIVAEGLSRDGSYGVWQSVQAGIGAMPLLLFGAEEQKQRYLPRLANAELIAAYALTEPQAGSDALAIRTRADLEEGGANYILNGQKMWISNASGAGLFTVFAKVGGEKIAAFLVERDSPGLSIGAEENKMGIKGSSTCAVYFENVKVPVENMLGEAGRGHVIAFNCLNLGRLKIGAGVMGNAKRVLGLAIKYAKQRVAFGQPIANYGLIQQKIAEMAVRIYAAETLVWRVTGMIEERLFGISWSDPKAGDRYLKAFEEFAAECAMVKVFTTEALDYVVDEAVQIHGGYGYHHDYEVERAYRDSRINRIFEGTNEINRMLATSMLIKRAQQKRLDLPKAVKALERELLERPVPPRYDEDPLEPCLTAADNARKAALLLLGAAFRKYPADLAQQQEILAGITDVATMALALESAALRARKRDGGIAVEMCQAFAPEAVEKVESTGRAVLAASCDGDALRVNLGILRRFTRLDAIDSFGVRRRIAARLLEAERYLA
ncbi:MAG: acyl-CoA dehydrogenase family protein [Bryobacteraceae bacterium]|nr:acyl-CoA dehydrogenase family protein [Bryobacteraceae bacterium]